MFLVSSPWAINSRANVALARPFRTAAAASRASVSVVSRIVKGDVVRCSGTARLRLRIVSHRRSLCGCVPCPRPPRRLRCPPLRREGSAGGRHAAILARLSGCTRAAFVICSPSVDAPITSNRAALAVRGLRRCRRWRSPREGLGRCAVDQRVRGLVEKPLRAEERNILPGITGHVAPVARKTRLVD